MKAVIDTNIFISSFFGGKPKRVVDLWRKGKIELCISREILDEYADVTARFGLRHEEEIMELMNLFTRGFNSIWTFNPPHLTLEMNDPDDKKFLECAVACESNYIITGDADFRKIAQFEKIKILLPDEFLSLCGE